MTDISDQSQLANMSDSDAAALGATEHRDAAREQLAAKMGTTPDTIWGRAKQAMSDIGQGTVDAVHHVGDAVTDLGNKVAPYVGGAAGLALGGLPGAYVGFKAAGGQEATNAASDAERAAAKSQQRAAQAEAGNAPAPAPLPQSPAVGLPSDAKSQKAFEAEKKAGAQIIEAQAAKQAEADKALAQAQHNRSVQEAQAAVDHAEREREINTAKNQAEDWHRQYAEGRIDSDNLYKNEDGTTNYGRKIGAAIAVALGQLGASLSHGPNTALAIINGAIDRDVEDQRAKLSQTRDIAMQKQGKLQELQNADEHALDKATQYRMQAYADAKQNIDAMMNSTNDQEKKAKLAELGATIDATAAETAEKHAVTRADLAVRNKQLSIEESRAGAPSAKVVEQSKAAQAAKAALAEVKRINAKGGTSLSPADRNAGEAARSRLIMAISSAKNMPLKSARDVLENMVGGNPASAGAWAREGIYKQVEAYINDQSAGAANDIEAPPEGE